MKVLLTGASGFVGSHVLGGLCRQEIPTVLLTRASSSARFFSDHLGQVGTRSGSLEDRPSLQQALQGVTHVVHCAGCTKAVSRSEFARVNHHGTRNLAEAAAAAGVSRFVHVSSLAAGGPGTAAQPAREADPPQPVSEYGRSKLLGEEAVREVLPENHVIVRPPAVYGPRDSEFLRLFRAVTKHVLPRPGDQPLSLVYVEDLAGAIVGCLEHPKAPGKTFYAAHREVVSGALLAKEVAQAIGCWTVPFPLPPIALWPVCLFSEAAARITKRASVLSLQKYPELRAPGWVCDSSRMERELGIQCATTMREGVQKTLAWYRANRWL